MKNTLIPLSIAFIDDTGAITSIKNMEPHSSKVTTSAGVASYALEVNQGWFKLNGVRVGDKIVGLPASLNASLFD
jgi:uncharacterized membrane protein (UPF0127 family)|tara:strand:- start:216 stop:440 length:225 start_codon:yes stop_codon:yes gene_type:complete